MGYGKEVYRKAEMELNLRRQRAQSDAETRRRRIYGELPEVKQLEEKLVHTGVAAARAVFAGGNTTEVLKKLRDENLQTQTKLKELLASKSYRPEDLEERYYCPTCKDKGYVDGKICSCLKKLLRDTAFKELNEISPLPLDKSSFDSFDLSYYSDQPTESGKIPRTQMSKIFYRCCDYAEDFQKGSKSILMAGGTGLGKTHLSLAIAGRVLDRGFGVIYGSAPDFLSLIERDNFSKSHERTTFERLEQCDLLIFDDLGTEFQTTFSKSSVYNLINSRIARGRATIINTNLSLNELRTAYTSRFVSRLVGENIYLPFIGDDIRLKRAIEKR